MIKIFRNIRRKLLGQGKTRRYLGYAVGEILLVMIGILLALQVNNWNQERINSGIEYNYLQRIEEDLVNQIADLDSNINFENIFFKACETVISDFTSATNIVLDQETIKALNDIVVRRTFFPISTAFDELNSSGNLNIIQDELLRTSIIKYYRNQKTIVKTVDNNNQKIDAMLSGTYMHNIVFNPKYFSTSLAGLLDFPEDSKNLKVEKMFMTESKVLLNEPKTKLAVINQVQYRKTSAKFHVNVYSDLKEQSVNLIEQIRSKLND